MKSCDTLNKHGCHFFSHKHIEIQPNNTFQEVSLFLAEFEGLTSKIACGRRQRMRLLVASCLIQPILTLATHPLVGLAIYGYTNAIGPNERRRCQVVQIV